MTGRQVAVVAVGVVVAVVVARRSDCKPAMWTVWSLQNTFVRVQAVHVEGLLLANACLSDYKQSTWTAYRFHKPACPTVTFGHGYCAMGIGLN